MSKTKSVSFPIFGILGLIFVTLKLAEIGTVATWSWLWVLSPFWLPLTVILSIASVVGLIAIVIAYLDKK